MLRTLLLAALAGLIAAPAPARATNEAGTDARFNELDVNNDGKLSRDEYAVLQREAAEKLATGRHSIRRTSAAGGSK
jgi:hypothetical protein